MAIAICSSSLKWAVPASIGLHAFLIFMVAARFSTPSSSAPTGVELRYSETSGGLHPTRSQALSREKAATQKVVDNPEATASAAKASEAGTSAPVGAKDGVAMSALERYKFELRQFLDSRKVYPEAARRLRQTGTVVVRFRVSVDGRIDEVVVIESNASSILNRAAQDLVKQAARFKPIPQEAGVQELKLSFPIEYIL